jgi:hypothetical protein
LSGTGLAAVPLDAWRDRYLVRWELSERPTDEVYAVDGTAHFEGYTAGLQATGCRIPLQARGPLVPSPLEKMISLDPIPGQQVGRASRRKVERQPDQGPVIERQLEKVGAVREGRQP